MRRLSVLLLLCPLSLCAIVLAGCGGSSKPAWQDASKCLRPLATFFDHGRPLVLPFPNPFAEQPTQMTSPKVFERELELSYPASGKGANAAAFYVFDAETDAKRVLKRILDKPRFVPTGNLEAIGPAIVRWSSDATPKQHAAVADCLTH